MGKIYFEASSFRDPSGFLFKSDGILFRQINNSYKANYDQLMSSGFFDVLIEQGLIIPHEEVLDILAPHTETAYKIIKPQEVGFISYPYEWCLLQFRGAALTTLRIAKLALEYGMILKDASAYNMQFYKGRWCLIDTLSFERYEEGKPWVAYKQFCQHFLAPIAIMAYKDPRLGLMSRLFIDGIPLDIVSKLLPVYSGLRFGLLAHIHLHARSQSRYGDKPINEDIKRGNFNRQSMNKLYESLRQTIKSLNMKLDTTEWADYYKITNYSEEAFEEKKAIVESFIDQVKPKTVWDLGANTGEFSRIASQKGIFTVAFDKDPVAVTKNYIEVRQTQDLYQLPLIMDLTNPSPGLGWCHQERKSLVERGPVEMVLALALVHHLAISNNLPFEKIAKFLRKTCKYLVIEFIPKSDSQVVKLLRNREDIFCDYNLFGFDEAFSNNFEILKKQAISGSDRIIYLMKSK